MDAEPTLLDLHAAVERRRLMKNANPGLRDALLARLDAGAPDAIHQPSGFYRLDLGRVGATTLRLHVWPRQREGLRAMARVHDHSWRLFSVVLAGRIGNVSYEAKPASKDDATHQAQFVDYDGLRNMIRNDGTFVRASARPPEWHAAGEAYGMAPRLFHDTEVEDGAFAATLVAATDESPDAPRCLAAVDAAPYAMTRATLDAAASNALVRDVAAALEASPWR